MPEEPQYEPERRGRDAVQILNRVRGEPGEERPRPLPLETLGQTDGRAQREQSEPHRQQMSRNWRVT